MVDRVNIPPEFTGADAPVDNTKVEPTPDQGQQGDAPAGSPKHTPPERPEWCPEKFWDAEKGVVNQEALAKSYLELEKTFKGKPKEGEVKDGADKNSPPEPTPEDAEKVLEEKGLDFQKFTEEFMENQGLTEESYAALEKAGIPKEIVDSYIQGQMAQAEAIKSSVYDAVGGEEEYTAMLQWASQNLSKEAIEAYNANVASTNKEQVLLAVRGLKARYQEDLGKNPSNLILGNNNTPSSGGRFESTAQLVEAMSDPRYKTDPAYQRMVQEKLARSNIL